MTTPFLVKLLYRTPLSLSVKLEDEQKLSVWVANWLREISIDGALRAVWTHVPNEGKRSMTVAQILKAMGLIPGTSDYLFLWRDGSGVIELKTGRNKETDNQIGFFLWCDALGVHRATCRSLDEVKEVLTRWGVYGQKKHIEKDRPAPNPRDMTAIPVNQAMIDNRAGSPDDNGGTPCRKSSQAVVHSAKYSVDDRRRASRIVESLCDRYGARRTAELIGISTSYVCYVKNMTLERNGYKAPDAAICSVFRAEKSVVWGVSA